MAERGHLRGVNAVENGAENDADEEQEDGVRNGDASHPDEVEHDHAKQQVDGQRQ